MLWPYWSRMAASARNRLRRLRVRCSIITCSARPRRAVKEDADAHEDEEDEAHEHAEHAMRGADETGAGEMPSNETTPDAAPAGSDATAEAGRAGDPEE